MVRKRDNELKNFEFSIQFQYELNLPLSLGVKIVIGFFTTAALIGMGIGTVYLLHVKHIIDLEQYTSYGLIPKWARKGCFKHYVSPAERAAVLAEIERKKQLAMKQELNERLQLKPNEKGYKIEDSWFSDHSSNIDFDPNDNRNPNLGIRIPDQVLTYIYQGKKGSDDASQKSGDTLHSQTQSK